MEIIILLAASLKGSLAQEGVEDYLRRASRRYPSRIITVRGEKVKPGTSHAPALQKEAKRLIERIPKRFQSVALEVEGKPMDSIAFAKRIRRLEEGAIPGIAFLVGGAYGLDPKLSASCQWTLSLSQMTLPHQMATLVLAEQIYRASTIAMGTPYHKA